MFVLLSLLLLLQSRLGFVHEERLSYLGRDGRGYHDHRSFSNKQGITPPPLPLSGSPFVSFHDSCGHRSLHIFGRQHPHYSVDSKHRSNATRPITTIIIFGNLNHTQEAHAAYMHTHHITPVPTYTKMGTYEVMQAEIG